MVTHLSGGDRSPWSLVCPAVLLTHREEAGLRAFPLLLDNRILPHTAVGAMHS